MVAIGPVALFDIGHPEKGRGSSNEALGVYGLRSGARAQGVAALEGRCTCAYARLHLWTCVRSAVLQVAAWNVDFGSKKLKADLHIVECATPFCKGKRR